jgi:acetyltransferase-like isoleucine patch superfamily enzyme
MRKLILKVARKIRLRFSSFYTWILSSSFESIGEGVRIDFPIRIENPESISIGRDSVLYQRSWYNPVSEWAGRKYNGKIKIGERVMLGYGLQISAASSIVIEDGAIIAAGVVIMDHMHEYRDPTVDTYTGPISEPRPVHIGKGAFLGVYCFIGPGVQIGEHAVVSANAVVTKDVPAYCIAIGNPARIIRFHDSSETNTARLSTVQG